MEGISFKISLNIKELANINKKRKNFGDDFSLLVEESKRIKEECEKDIFGLDWKQELKNIKKLKDTKEIEKKKKQIEEQIDYAKTVFKREKKISSAICSPTIDLLKINQDIEAHPVSPINKELKITNIPQLIPELITWSQHFKNDLAGRLEYERRVTDELNKWMRLLTTGNIPGINIAVLEKKDDDDYWKVNISPMSSLVSQFATTKVLSIDHKALTIIREMSFEPGALPTTPIDYDTGLPILPPLLLKEKTLWNIWYKHSRRGSSSELVFNPRPIEHAGAARVQDLNTYSGMTWSRDTVLPYQEWNLIHPLLAYIRYTWCDSQEEYETVLAIFALLIQEPWLKQQIALCISGEEENGKSWVFTSVIGRILGPSFVHIQDIRDVFGKFNSAIQNSLYVFLDGVTFSNKYSKQMKKLKNLIIQPTQEVKKKYRDKICVQSFTNIGIANDKSDFILKVGFEEAKKFFMLHFEPNEILDFYKDAELFGKDDKLEDYFTWLINMLKRDEECGIKTFCNFLYNLEVPKSFYLRNIPNTQLVRVNKINNLNDISLYVYNILLEGSQLNVEVVIQDNGIKRTVTKEKKWYNKLPLERLSKDYFNKQEKKTNTQMDHCFLEKLMKQMPVTVTTEIESCITQVGVLEIKRKMIYFPSLEECRKQFDKLHPGVSGGWKIGVYKFRNRIPIKQFLSVDEFGKPIVEQFYDVEAFMEGILPNNLFGTMDLKKLFEEKSFPLKTSAQFKPLEDRYSVCDFKKWKNFFMYKGFK